MPSKGEIAWKCEAAELREADGAAGAAGKGDLEVMAVWQRLREQSY
jgi:hypothetical protein